MVNGFDLMSAIRGSSMTLLVFYIFLVVGQWKIFEKAGEEGWKSLIPIYNAYILWKIAGKNFWKTFGVFVGLLLLAILAASTGSGFLAFLGIVLYLAAFIYLLVATCGFCEGLSRAFGHGGGFAAGLFFLQPIFLIILGFNGDQYQG